MRVYAFVAHSHWMIFITSAVALGSPTNDLALYGTEVFLLMLATSVSVAATLRLQKRIWLVIFCVVACLVLLSVLLLLLAAAGTESGSFINLLIPVMLAITVLGITRFFLEHFWDVTLFF